MRKGDRVQSRDDRVGRVALIDADMAYVRWDNGGTEWLAARTLRPEALTVAHLFPLPKVP